MHTEFSLVTLKSGVKSLRSLTHGETYHPGVGPVTEARILHVEQQKLVSRVQEISPFIVWDVGLGAAGNALTAIRMLQEQSVGCNVHFHSFDLSTRPLEFALRNATELGYLVGYENEVNSLITKGEATFSGGQITWHLHLGDFRKTMKDTSLPSPHAIFYDPYSASGNREMWTLEHFLAFAQVLDAGTPWILTNYTRSTAIRVSLLMAGFFVGQGCIIGDKAETTLASNRLELLDSPLDRRWLERVRQSTRSAPLREDPAAAVCLTEGEFEQLKNCKQFL